VDSSIVAAGDGHNINDFLDIASGSASASAESGDNEIDELPRSPKDLRVMRSNDRVNEVNEETPQTCAARAEQKSGDGASNVSSEELSPLASGPSPSTSLAASSFFPSKHQQRIGRQRGHYEDEDDSSADDQTSHHCDGGDNKTSQSPPPRRRQMSIRACRQKATSLRASNELRWERQSQPSIQLTKKDTLPPDNMKSPFVRDRDAFRPRKKRRRRVVIIDSSDDEDQHDHEQEDDDDKDQRAQWAEQIGELVKEATVNIVHQFLSKL
jgi:hypothetical protein